MIYKINKMFKRHLFFFYKLSRMKYVIKFKYKYKIRNMFVNGELSIYKRIKN